MVPAEPPLLGGFICIQSQYQLRMMFWVCAGKEAVCFVFSLLLVAPTSWPLSPKSPLAVFNHIGPVVYHCSCGTGWLSEPDPEEEEPMGQHPGQGHLLHPPPPPVWTPPWDSSPGRTLPIPLVSPVTNDFVTPVLFTFCSSGLEAASVENSS